MQWRSIAILVILFSIIYIMRSSPTAAWNVSRKRYHLTCQKIGRGVGLALFANILQVVLAVGHNTIPTLKVSFFVWVIFQGTLSNYESSTFHRTPARSSFSPPKWVSSTPTSPLRRCPESWCGGISAYHRNVLKWLVRIWQFLTFRVKVPQNKFFIPEN